MSALCMFHSRFSTNTFPSWELAHPYRMISHNGEINTLRGNINWMRAREALFDSELYEPGDIAARSCRSSGRAQRHGLPRQRGRAAGHGRAGRCRHAMMMLIPEAWDNHETMSQVKKDFYGYHSCLMEPWDGPASVAFTDGKTIGAVLDRNGLPPSRYVVTKDDRVIMASEVGVLPIAPENVVQKGRLEPGKMFLVDLEQGRIVDDEELKHKIASAKPYGEWLESYMVPPGRPAGRARGPRASDDDAPPAAAGLRLLRSRTSSTSSARWAQRRGSDRLDGHRHPAGRALRRAQPLFNYFKQLFAQVTNPPLDAIREELVTSVTGAGGEGEPARPGAAKAAGRSR